MIRFHVLWAVFSRNLQAYFSGVIGYLFIVVFVIAGAFAAFNARFFAQNLANLDQLSYWFPLLLLFLVPAITMGAWADERKSKTDELLFTLPAKDVEILLGKYFAVLAVYTIALCFSMTYLAFLAWIGDPDWGQIAATYLGYWLAGAALLSVGLVGSSLTSNTTVGFVLAAVLCSALVLIGYDEIVGYVAFGQQAMHSLSISTQLQDFAQGQIPLTGLLYFLSLTVFMLYLNLVVITRRHWVASQQAVMGLQYAVRVVALAAILVSFNFIAMRTAAAWSTRVDMTAENLYTLTPVTRETLEKLGKKKQAITIQAFVSPDVPREYVSTRKQLLGLLDQYDRLGGKWVDVRRVNVSPNSPATHEARSLGVERRRTITDRGGKKTEQDVYLGVVITSSRDEVVIPFVEDGMAIEYELTRAMGTVLEEERLTVGILVTDAHMHIHLEQPQVNWIFKQLVAELQKNYELKLVQQTDLAAWLDEETDEESEDDEEEDHPPDVLLVVQPSSLTSGRLNDLVRYIQEGYPTLIFDDPVPFYPFVYQSPAHGLINAPRQERPAPNSRLAVLSTAPQMPTPQIPPQLAQLGQQFVQQWLQENPEYQPRYEPKASGGRATALLDALGIEWDHGRIVWDMYDPHPDFAPAWPEWVDPDERDYYGPEENVYLFVGDDSGTELAFDGGSSVTAGLRQLVAFYAGEISHKKGEKDTEFTPLLRTGPNSGTLEWEDFTEPMEQKVTRRNPLTGSAEVDTISIPSPYTAQPIRRLVARPPRDFDSDAHTLAAHIQSTKRSPDDINAIFVADIDLLTDMAFETEQSLTEPLDNSTFVLNAIEVLADQDDWVSLRSRRPNPRVLSVWQETTDRFRRERRTEQRKAEEKVEEELTEARERLTEKTEEISQDEELGILQKLQSVAFTADTEQQKFERRKAKLERELNERIQELEDKEQRQIDRYETRIQMLAVLIPPVPAILLGLVVLVMRTVQERRQIQPERRVS